MAYNNKNDSDKLAFNKDLAKLMELQRIEIIANNYAIEGSQQPRLNALKRWYGMLKGLLKKMEKKDEINEIETLFNQSRPIKYKNSLNVNTEALDKLHDLLNEMNIICQVEFTVGKKDDFLEPEVEWD